MFLIPTYWQKKLSIIVFVFVRLASVSTTTNFSTPIELNHSSDIFTI